MIVKEKIIFIDNEFDHTLTIDKQKNKTVFTLFYSEGIQWNTSIRGEIALQVIDDGNGIKIVGQKGGKLDYSKTLYLSIILREIHSDYTFNQAIKNEF